MTEDERKSTWDKQRELIEVEEKAEYDFLDTLDILDYIRIAGLGDFEVWEVMKEIQKCELENYQKFLKDNNLTITEGGENELFNCIDDYDFIDYVERRYPKNVTHHEIIRTNLSFELLEGINEKDEENDTLEQF